VCRNGCAGALGEGITRENVGTEQVEQEKGELERILHHEVTTPPAFNLSHSIEESLQRFSIRWLKALTFKKTRSARLLRAFFKSESVNFENIGVLKKIRAFIP
jgi:hypothetical protein